jgi:uncharacterized damage-inducible protein DinB
MPETPQQYTQRIKGYMEGKDALQVQQETHKKLQKLVKPLSKKQLGTRPEPGKWSICEILAHLVDAELVGSWRMRSIIGSSGIPVQAFNQDVWAERLDYAGQDAKESLETFGVLRANNLRMLKALPPDLWENYGMHQERGRESIRHLVAMFAGHDLNHLGQIERIAKSSGTKRKARA